MQPKVSSRDEKVFLSIRTRSLGYLSAPNLIATHLQNWTGNWIEKKDALKSVSLTCPFYSTLDFDNLTSQPFVLLDAQFFYTLKLSSVKPLKCKMQFDLYFEVVMC